MFCGAGFDLLATLIGVFFVLHFFNYLPSLSLLGCYFLCVLSMEMTYIRPVEDRIMSDDMVEPLVMDILTHESPYDSSLSH